MVNGQKKSGYAALVAMIEGGDREGALAHARRMEREAARRAAKSLLPADPAAYLEPEWRAQWSGLDFVGITKTLAKTVFSSDTAGKRGLDYWTGRVLDMLDGEDPDGLALQVAEAVVEREAERDSARRLSLVRGLMELQVQHAEALGEDPAKWIRPITVTGPEPRESDEREPDEPAPELVDLLPEDEPAPSPARANGKARAPEVRP